MTDTTELSFQAQVYADIEQMPNRLRFPERSNVGREFSMLLMWKKVEQFAAKRYETLITRLVSEEAIDDPKALTTPGNYVLGEAGKVSVQVNVSVPRREFNLEWLAKRLNKDYKIPEAITRQLVEEAKRPGKTQVRRVTVIEKGTGL
jgi:hypothetical protein